MTCIRGAWLNHPGTQQVFAALADQGFAARFVGGCVRNALLGEPVGDIDIASPATPDQTMSCARAAGLRAIPTGADHGTVTVVAGGLAHEITTYRADVETDGRHAVVRFSTKIETDAARRDFTMNALYADSAGRVIDPLGGLADLQARRVRFVGDAATRIAEDHLRSLRFFRFYACYGDPAEGPDPEALAAIAASLGGLDSLSRERVGAEIVKLMRARDPSPAVASMAHVGALAKVLPGALPKSLAPMVHLEPTVSAGPDAIRRLAALGWNDGRALRLSRADTRRLALLHEQVGGTETPEVLGYRYGLETGRDVILLRAAMLETPIPEGVLDRLDFGARAKCPVTAQDLMPEHSGPSLGRQLRDIETAWLESRMTLTKAELLSRP